MVCVDSTVLSGCPGGADSARRVALPKAWKGAGGGTRRCPPDHVPEAPDLGLGQFPTPSEAVPTQQPLVVLSCHVSHVASVQHTFAQASAVEALPLWRRPWHCLPSAVMLKPLWPSQVCPGDDEDEEEDEDEDKEEEETPSSEPSSNDQVIDVKSPFVSRCEATAPRDVPSTSISPYGAVVIAVNVGLRLSTASARFTIRAIALTGRGGRPLSVGNRRGRRRRYTPSVCIVLPTHHTTHNTITKQHTPHTTHHTIRYTPLYTIRHDTPLYTLLHTIGLAVFSHLSVELNPCSQFAVYQ